MPSLVIKRSLLTPISVTENELGAQMQSCCLLSGPHLGCVVCARRTMPNAWAWITGVRPCSASAGLDANDTLARVCYPSNAIRAMN